MSFNLPPSPESTRDFSLAPEKAPKSYSLKKYRGPILYQADTNACTGFGTAGMLNALFSRTLKTSFDFSPWYIWDNAKKRANYRNYNTGVPLRYLCESVLHDGVVENDVYDKYKENVPETYKVKIGAFYRLGGKSPKELYESISHVIGNEKLPVGLGIRVYEKAWDDANMNGVWKSFDKDRYLGGHFMYSDEYDETGITLVNSFGKLWGAKGCAKISWIELSRVLVEGWHFNAELP